MAVEGAKPIKLVADTETVSYHLSTVKIGRERFFASLRMTWTFLAFLLIHTPIGGLT